VSQPPVSVVPGLGERVVVHLDSRGARWVGASAVLGAACWLIAGNRPGWSLTVLAAVTLIARGIFLGRPVTAMHATAAMLVLTAGLSAHVLSIDLLGDALVVGSGLVLMWPTSARPRPDDLSRIWGLVNATSGDPLAPFVMQTGKCYHFSASGAAALAYRTRMGFAAVSGDPIGDETQFAGLVADFAATCHTHGWRIAVVGCSQRRLPLWGDGAALGQPLRPIPIGRDVVVEVGAFDMTGRKFRNLRQAEHHTYNIGITTEIVDEQELGERQRAELREMLLASPKGAHTDRGFAMSLDGVLEGRYPGMKLIIARDAFGRVQGFHRYAIAGGGSDYSLDVPWRRRGAPNGIDERLSVDMIAAAKIAGAQRVSLSFAAFPDILDEEPRGKLERLFHSVLHIFDPLIRLESLDHYVHKFHALDERRYALISMAQVVPLIFVLLSLEFFPRRRHL